MDVIEIKNLEKYYGKTIGVKSVSFNVMQGEIFGFIGPNGAGKSTTIRSILKLLQRSAGEIKVFGMNIDNYHEEILENIGYVPSEVNYYDNMTGKDVLSYSQSFYKKDCSKKIKELAEILDFDLSKKVESLSFGNKKKLAIIDALMHEPKLIILDEPTSGLDPLIQQKFFELLKKENKKGVTILFSSHVLTEVEKICDRVAIIKDGKIIKVDKVSEIYKNGYKKVKIDFKDDLSLNSFNIKEITNFKVNKKSCTFFYNGDLNDLIKMMSEIKIINILIEDSTLEEIFIHYYDRV